jgi:hypothetical protein
VLLRKGRWYPVGMARLACLPLMTSMMLVGHSGLRFGTSQSAVPNKAVGYLHAGACCGAHVAWRQQVPACPCTLDQETGSWGVGWVDGAPTFSICHALQMFPASHGRARCYPAGSSCSKVRTSWLAVWPTLKVRQRSWAYPQVSYLHTQIAGQCRGVPISRPRLHMLHELDGVMRSNITGTDLYQLQRLQPAP